LYIKEGFWNDTISLYVDDKLLVIDKINLLRLRDYALFEIDGRTHELRWIWSMWTGNPSSIVVMHKGRIIAQYGDDRAAKDNWFEDKQ
jgi:hypothetical protein